MRIPVSETTATATGSVLPVSGGKVSKRMGDCVWFTTCTEYVLNVYNVMLIMCFNNMQMWLRILTCVYILCISV